MGGFVPKVITIGVTCYHSNNDNNCSHQGLLEDIPNKVVNYMGLVVDVNLNEQDGLDSLN